MSARVAEPGILREPIPLGPLPLGARLRTVDERVVPAGVEEIFALAAAVEEWPRHLPHYRSVRFHARSPDGGGVVEMAAVRPFGVLRWPTWWVSQMAVVSPTAAAAPGAGPPRIRYRHVAGITRSMEVEWSFAPVEQPLAPQTGSPCTLVRIVHSWEGPPWPAVGGLAATAVIGPVFIHGIASRTLAGLAAVAERRTSARFAAGSDARSDARSEHTPPDAGAPIEER